MNTILIFKHIIVNFVDENTKKEIPTLFWYFSNFKDIYSLKNINIHYKKNFLHEFPRSFSCFFISVPLKTSFSFSAVSWNIYFEVRLKKQTGEKKRVLTLPPPILNLPFSFHFLNL